MPNAIPLHRWNAGADREDGRRGHAGIGQAEQSPRPERTNPHVGELHECVPHNVVRERRGEPGHGAHGEAAEHNPATIGPHAVQGDSYGDGRAESECRERPAQ
jgi:hypothetical protein